MMRETLVAELMQPEVAFLRPDESLDLVDDLMSLGRVRHLPVVEDERLVGVVSHRDLIAAALSKQSDVEPLRRREFLREIKVRDVMSTDLATIAPTATLAEAAEALLERRVGALPVLLGTRLVGILSEADLVRHAYLDVAGAGALSSTLTGRLVELRRLGEEFRVQAHLGRAEAQDLWEDLEQRLEALGADLVHARVPGDGVLGTLIAGVQGLLEDLRRTRKSAADAPSSEAEESHLDTGGDPSSL
jgi:CBS domain-containing protein